MWKPSDNLSFEPDDPLIQSKFATLGINPYRWTSQVLVLVWL